MSYSEDEEIKKNSINESTKYLISLKNQYDILMRENELINERKFKFNQLKDNLFSWVDENGKPLKNSNLNQNNNLIIEDLNSIENLNLQKFEIPIWPYLMEDINIKK